MTDHPSSTEKSKFNNPDCLFSEYTKIKDELDLFKKTYRDLQSRSTTEIAILEQKIQLQRIEIEEYKDKAQMQRELYDSMVNALKWDDKNNSASYSMQNQIQLAQKIYQSNIDDLKKKHELHIESTITQFTQKCENLYAYIKDAERLLGDMDQKRKKERKEMHNKHQSETHKLHKSYQSQLNKLKSKLDNLRHDNYDAKSFSSRYSNSKIDSEMQCLKEEIHVKSTMLEEANDQIVWLKSKLHGLRTIIDQLRVVEKKYNKVVSKRRDKGKSIFFNAHNV